MNYYAGLASAMMALVFLYFTALIFIYGGELNAAIARAREDPSLPLEGGGRKRHRLAGPKPRPPAPVHLIAGYAGMSGV